MICIIDTGCALCHAITEILNIDYTNVRLRRCNEDLLNFLGGWIMRKLQWPLKAYLLRDATTGLTFNNCTLCPHGIFKCFLFIWEQTATCATYVGESNKNFKFVIKNRNFALLTCKLVSVLQIACRMGCRWQHSADARTPSQYQYKDGCPTWDLHQGRTAFCYSVFA